MHWLTIAAIVSGVLLVSVLILAFIDSPDWPGNLFAAVISLAVLIVLAAGVRGLVALYVESVGAARGTVPAVVAPAANPTRVPLRCACECSVSAEKERP